MFDFIMKFSEGGDVYATSAKTVQYFTPDSSLNQDVLQRNLENLQIQRFKRILDKEGSKLMFRKYERANTDPPDFIITRNNTLIGLELTAATNQHRMRLANKLSVIKDYFKAQYHSGRLQGFRGFIINLKLHDSLLENSRSKFESELENVRDFLDLIQVPPNFKFDISKIEVPYPLSEVYSSGNITVSFVSHFTRPSTQYAFEVGFDIEIDCQMDYKQDDVCKLLNEKVKRKDKPENQELLIVVGGPNQRGTGNPDEAAPMYHFFSKSLVKLEQPQYLRRVYILLWPYSKYYLFDFAREQKFNRFKKRRR